MSNEMIRADSSVSLVVSHRRRNRYAEDCVFWMLNCLSIVYAEFLSDHLRVEWRGL